MMVGTLKSSNSAGAGKAGASRAAAIAVVGARTHNLRGLSVEIPRDQFVVITGVSGSGKSSLVFDTLHAEGQRRYLETVSFGRRGLLEQWRRPDVDAITGLPPTLSVSQRAGSARPRSTLATTTEIAHRLRILFARAGVAHSPHGSGRVERHTIAEMIDAVMALGEKTKAMILAPLEMEEGMDVAAVMSSIAKEGFVRARVNGEVLDASQSVDSIVGSVKSIEAVVDRIVVKPGIEPRLRDSLELALKQGGGTCLVSASTDEGWVDRRYSENFICGETGEHFGALEPRSFSFNNPAGACGRCHGLGWVKVPGAARGEDSSEVTCLECLGERLNAFSRRVTFVGVRFPEFLAWSVEEARDWCAGVRERVEREEAGLDLTMVGVRVARKVLPELLDRLNYLVEVGLGYLTLDRPTRTLSGGEFQRARLASALGSGLVGVCYLLDEPTIGLHPRDVERLIGTLRGLREAGNSLVVVEHDLSVISAADLVLEIGPGAGSQGGRLVARGTPAEIAADAATATGPFLRGPGDSCERERRSVEDGTPRLKLRGLTANNVRELDVDVPLERFVAVTGVSGSGKSTLVMDLLVPLVKHALAGQTREDAWEGRSARGQLDAESALPRRLIAVDQTSLGRSGRSTPATYCGIWDEVRKLFSRTKMARQLGFRARRFSFLSPEGRCQECEGAGTKTLAMKFLPDLEIVCPVCDGRRFNSQTLMVTFAGKSVADVLALSIDEAIQFFAEHARIVERLRILSEVGLGYLRLGQSALSLSGGEAQRIRLASELSLPGQLGTEPTLFVLDEPTTGLHALDTERLLDLLQRLVDQGHSIVAIEHDPAFIGAADWVIDMGPEGGAMGGGLVASGTPEQIAGHAPSLTGAALRRIANVEVAS